MHPLASTLDHIECRYWPSSLLVGVAAVVAAAISRPSMAGHPAAARLGALRQQRVHAPRPADRQRRTADAQQRGVRRCRCSPPQGADASAFGWPQATFLVHTARQHDPQLQHTWHAGAASQSLAAGIPGTDGRSQQGPSRARAARALSRIARRDWPRALVAASVAPCVLLGLQPATAGAPPDLFPVRTRRFKQGAPSSISACCEAQPYLAWYRLR